MKFKQEYEVALSNDLIVSEADNADEIYLVRVEYDEYIVGKGFDRSNKAPKAMLFEFKNGRVLS